ncbi:MAG: ABC1 kinase family protein [Acidimicrobiales bacterium]
MPRRHNPTRDAASVLSDRSVRRLTPRELWRALVVGTVVNRRVGPGLLRRRTRTAAALAPRLHKAVLDLGPPFVKLSQLIASSPGLFPAPIADELRVLLDAAPPERWPAIKAVIEAELGRPVGEVFANIDPEPLAAASIAQVHAATLPNGDEVVVKVRRPGVERQFRTDLRLLRRIARMTGRLSRHARVVNPVAIVDNVVYSLREELDFVREADSMERFEANLRAFGDNKLIRVPHVYRDLTTPAVLTMERVWGTKVDDLPGLTATGYDLLERLRAGVRAWIEAACEHGFFHGDVHAGNLLVDTDGRVVFFDFGIMGELDHVTRDLVRRGVVALLHDLDFREVTRCLVELGAHLGARVELDRAAAAIQELAEPELSKPIAEIDYQHLFVSAVRRAAPHGVQLPRSMVLLAKQVIYFERYAKLVAPDYQILADTYLIEFMTEPGGTTGGNGARPRR